MRALFGDPLTTREDRITVTLPEEVAGLEGQVAAELDGALVSLFAVGVWAHECFLDTRNTPGTRRVTLVCRGVAVFDVWVECQDLMTCGSTVEVRVHWGWLCWPPPLPPCTAVGWTPEGT